MDDPKLFENQIKISVTGKIATLESKNFELVGGNNDYSVVFTFDEPWQEYPVKTAIFTFGDTPVFKVFDGDVCDGVVISNSTACYIGVLAGDLITTTPALIRDIRLSITDVSEGTPEEPTEDVYNQIMELLNRYIEQGGGGVGNDGATFIPQISEDGILSWTNDKGLENPEPVRIVGKDGEAPTIEIDDNGFWVIGGYNTGVKAKGEDGHTPVKGVDYFDGKDGKNAYQYAVDGGYEGSEGEFAQKMATPIPTKTSDLENDSNFLTQHQDLSDYAKSSEIPTKTSEITNDSGFITNSDIPVTSVNNKTGAVSLSAGDVGARPDNWTPTASEVKADPEGKAVSVVSIHNTSPDSHNDIRLWIQGVADRLNHALDSTDLDLDQLSEIVQYIKSNSSLIATITTNKINYSDIIDNLTTSVDNRPLSAKQGVVLKALIDAIVIPTKVSELANDKGYITGYTESDPTVPAWAKSQNKPTYTASEVGALSETALTSAINTALAQAKASGEFKGADGKTAYEYAKEGGYIGTEAEFAEKLADEWALADDVFEITKAPLFENVFDTVGLEYGKKLENDGTVTDTEARLATTDFISVQPNYIIRVNNDFKLLPTGNPKIVLYNSSKSFLQSVNTSQIQDGGYYIKSLKKDAEENVLEFQILRPANTAFIRICNSTTVMGDNPILTINEEIKYEEQYGYLLNPKIRVEQSQILNAPQKNGWSILPTEHIGICYSGINRKPINTAEHFVDVATNFGYNALKCDVRPTADGELVCCHDAGFTFDGNGYITTYDSSNQTLIHDVTAATCLGYSFKTGEHPCLVGDYLKICRTYGKVAFITIRNEYMDVVIPKLLEELKKHNMMYSSIINCMTYESLVTWRTLDKDVMINYTLSYGNAIDKAAIDKAVSLGYCSLCGFSLNSSQLEPTAGCDFEYARECGIRVGQAIAYKEGSPEKCFEMGYDFCQIGIPWRPIEKGVSEGDVSSMINDAIGSAIGGAY